MIIIREEIEKRLDALTSIVSKFTDEQYWVNRSISCTDYGCSGYLNIRRPNGEWVKIRVSDHVASSHNRIFSEIMFSYDSNIDPNNAHLCEYLEQRICPENFKIVKTKHYTGQVKRFTYQADIVLKDYERVVERRIAKSGREVVVVEWDGFYFTEEIVRK